uniref:Uncharacterized protein n=1 Tax=Rhizophora mucronata TaxID=61149 RepID=A0A2P2NP99_RHIMU
MILFLVLSTHKEFLILLYTFFSSSLFHPISSNNPSNISTGRWRVYTV